MMAAWPSACSTCSRSGSGRRRPTPSGPMRAARTFALGLADDGLLTGRPGPGRAVRLARRDRPRPRLGRAVVLGLEGETPEDVDTDLGAGRAIRRCATAEQVQLLGKHPVRLGPDDLVLHRRSTLPFHPNGMRFTAFADGGRRPSAAPRADLLLGRRRLRGGRDTPPAPTGSRPTTPCCRTRSPPAPSCARTPAETGLPISELMLANELRLAAARTRSGPACCEIWQVMQDCVSGRLRRTRACCRAG